MNEFKINKITNEFLDLLIKKHQCDSTKAETIAHDLQHLLLQQKEEFLTRTEKIIEGITRYCLQDFVTPIEVSNDDDILDAVIVGLNMLGDELKHSTVNSIFFRNIIDKIPAFVFVVDKVNKIMYVNEYTYQETGYMQEDIQGVNIFDLIEKVSEVNNTHTHLLKNKTMDLLPISLEVFENSTQDNILIFYCNDKREAVKNSL
jgi:PAS domain-containing protein